MLISDNEKGCLIRHQAASTLNKWVSAKNKVTKAKKIRKDHQKKRPPTRKSVLVVLHYFVLSI